MTSKRITPKGHARRFIEKHMELRHQAIINNYIYVGEEALKIARTQHRYKRRTGNLASSIGYCILDEGKVLVMGGFVVEGNGEEGKKKGKDFLKNLIRQNSKGLMFIMVAGMRYASYVEAMNLDVLESADLFVQKTLPNICKALKL